jgi:protein gp37
MGDLFYEGVSNEQIAIVFGVMAACPQHIFQVLTKRADRMRAWFEWVVKRGDDGLRLFPDDPLDWRIRQFLHVSAQRAGVELPPHHGGPWPLRNVHLGVSVENQEYADKRIPQLLKTPAAVRFISAEPLLERVDISIYLYHGVIEAKPGDADFDALNWVIVGGESGPGARPFDVQWARRIVDDCAKAGVACFVKQLGANAHDSMRSMVGGWTLGPDTALRLEHKKGSDITEFPSDLRVRQFPEAP